MVKTQQELAIEKTSGPCVILAGAGTGKSYTVIKKIGNLVSSNIVESDEILCLTFSNEATNSLKGKIQDELGSDSLVTVKTFHAFCSDILKEDGHLIGIDEGFQLLLPDDAKIMMHKYLDISPYWSGRYINTIATAKDFGVDIEKIKEHVLGIKKKLLEYTEEGNIENFAKEKTLQLRTIHLMPSETVDERREQKVLKKEVKEYIELYKDYAKFNDYIIAWEKYEAFKKEKNYIDFSDLNDCVLQLFRQFDSDKYVDKFKYVFVDEFQDTNKLQFELIEFIAKHKNITVVGDPNQSIYGFRGSYKESFEHFKESFGVNSEEDIFRLEKCYRSPNTILNVSYDLIKNNYENLDDCLNVQNAHDLPGDKVKVVETVNQFEEARYISDLVEERIKSGTPKSEICILYRTHNQAEVIKQALEMKKVPVISAGRTNMLQTPEIKTVIAHLGILSNLIERSGTGEQAWWDLFHYQNNLSPEDSVKIGRYIKRANKNSKGERLPIEDQKGIDDILLCSLSDLSLSQDGIKTVKRVVEKLKKLISISSNPLPELVLSIYDLSGLNRRFTYERSVENMESLMNLKKFHEIVSSYYDIHGKTLPSFLHYLEIIDKVGVNIDSSKAMNVDAVRMMTVHASKGLEFDVVVVCNMATDRFPVSRVPTESLIPQYMLPDFKAEMESWGDIDEKMKARFTKEYNKKILTYEERRLCYVAWTRAKTELVLIHSKDYKGEPESAQASLFLTEIKYKENENCEFIEDTEELSTIIAPNSHTELQKTKLKGQIISSLDTEDFSSVLQKIADYISVRDSKAVSSDLSEIKLSESEINQEMERCKEEKPVVKFDRENFTFSPSSIMAYQECPKKFELSQLYQMPQRGDFDEVSEGTSGGAAIGSFVHLVLEEGVKAGFKAEEEFMEKAENLSRTSDWIGIDVDEAKGLIKVFWERNKGRYDDNSVCEMPLAVSIGDYKFFGIADRVDKMSNGRIHIIDYKTNKASISPKKRKIQLGFYALALNKLGEDVGKLTLEMLKLDKPVAMDVDEEGNVTGGATKASNFTLTEVEEELIEVCKDIEKDYESEFDVAEKEDPCKFCGYKFYCPKWEEK